VTLIWPEILYRASIRLQKLPNFRKMVYIRGCKKRYLQEVYDDFD
jgi:hypothetical protein